MLVSFLHPRSSAPRCHAPAPLTGDPNQLAPNPALPHPIQYQPCHIPLLTAFSSQEWGIDPTISARSGLAPPVAAGGGENPRRVVMLQRKRGKAGAGLGKTTGWIHRASLKKQAGLQKDGAVWC